MTHTATVAVTHTPKCMQGVNLSHNLLSLPDVGAAALGPPIPTLRKLVLNRCGVTWQQV